MSKQQQKKSGTDPKRKAIPLHSTALGRRILDLEQRVAALQSQRTMMVRAIGALAVAHAKALGDTHEEPAILIPFVDMNVARDVGFAIDKEGENPGFVVAVAKPVRPDEKIDSASEVAAMSEHELGLADADET